MTTADRVGVRELPGRYGNPADDRNWAKLDTVFIQDFQDVAFDQTSVSVRVCNGLDDISAFMESESAHPRTHLMINIYAESDGHTVELRLSHVRLLGFDQPNVNDQCRNQVAKAGPGLCAREEFPH